MIMTALLLLQTVTNPPGAPVAAIAVGPDGRDVQTPCEDAIRDGEAGWTGRLIDFMNREHYPMAAREGQIVLCDGFVRGVRFARKASGK